jgi:serine protease Do
MVLIRLLVLLIVGGSLAGVAHARPQSPLLPGVVLPKDVKLPGDVAVAAYLPANKREQRFFVSAGGFWAQPGKALEDSVAATLQSFFTSGFLVGPSDERPYGLLIVLHPSLKAESGSLQTTLSYKVYGTRDELLLEGKQSASAPMGDLGSGTGFYKSSQRAAQLVMVDVLTKLRPDSTKFPATATLKDFDPALLIDREAPVATGTGFFINAAGQVLTAAHVIHDCVVVDVKRDDRTFPGRVVASSNLLDLAVLDTATPAARFLPLRKNEELILGEPITNVGFPLQKILAASPNLTRGNVSSRGALAGSVGQFQFSAPIQPGSSGGPVVSDGGELLGVTVGTLNAAKLVESGALPQNVNFALDARYVAMFLRKNGIAFSEVEPNLKGDMRVGNEAALSTVLSLTCLQ